MFLQEHEAYNNQIEEERRRQEVEIAMYINLLQIPTPSSPRIDDDL